MLFQVIAVVGVALSVIPAAAILPSSIVFSGGFTSGGVLQSAPAASSVYGFVVPSGSAAPTVEAVLTLASGGAPVRVSAAVSANGAGAGSTCEAECYASGYLSSAGAISPCQAPSCAMGCIFAAAARGDAAVCSAACAAAKGKCTYDVNMTLGVWEMDECEGGLSGGGCPKDDECTQGCSFSGVTSFAWKVTLPPQPAHAVASLTVSCTSGCSAAESKATLDDLVFGSVYLCAGQSNMALGLEHTYNFPALVSQIKGGAYNNMRLFQWGSMGYQSRSDSPAWASTSLAYPDWTWLSPLDALNYTNGGGLVQLKSFPATCMYFATALIDLLGASAPPVGLIATAVGGTTIESWSDAVAYSACSEPQTGNSAAPPVTLFNGLVAPFVNASISGWVWYQGENNAGAPSAGGNSATGVGYGCQMPTLVSSWRKWWSAAPGTTDPVAPFGVVTLAATTSEGNGDKMAAMRWSSTANYGVLPNAIMPRTFLAQAFDLGDPWEMYNADSKNCSKPPRAPSCDAFSSLGYDASLLPLAPAIEADAAPDYMGGIHPRIKSPVGRRLAHALYHSQLGGTAAYTGPTISSCAVAGSTVTILYNASLLRGEAVLVSPFDTDMAKWGTDDSSSFMLCFPSLGAGDCLRTTSLWRAAPARAGATPGTVELTVPAPGTAPSAVRYGWPLSDAGDTCCPSRNVTSGRASCTPGACPVKTESSLLPANPFYANLTAGSCACLAPQICG